MLDQIEKRLNEINGGLVLDVATGGGEFINFIKAFSSFDKIIAIDKMERMKDVFNKRFAHEDNIEFRVMDAENPDFNENTFDTICISNSLHHFENLNNTLNQIMKILKPGGYLILNEMQSDNLSQSQKSHDMIHRFFAKIDEKRGMVHKPTFTSQEIVDTIKPLNLSKIQTFNYEYYLTQEQAENQVNNLLTMLDKQTEALKDNPDFENIKTKIEEIKTHLKENSYSPAKSVFIIAQKA